jgi:transcriptional regulator with XRE-family HTH domain
MTGNYVKNKLKASGFKLVDVAVKMGITPQNLEGKLKSNDIKVGVLESIAKSINKSVYFFFDSHKSLNKPNIIEEPRISYVSECRICKEKERVIKQQQALIDQQQKIIKLLEQK